MKRAKIILIALTVLTVVGGALAFKANKAFDGNLQCTFGQPDPSNPGNCPVKTYSIKNTGTPAWCKLTSDPSTVDCTFTRVIENP